MIRLVISQTAISKSICGNLNRRLKKRGIRRPRSRLEEEGTGPKEELVCWRAREMVGFMFAMVSRCVDCIVEVCVWYVCVDEMNGGCCGGRVAGAPSRCV